MKTVEDFLNLKPVFHFDEEPTHPDSVKAFVFDLFLDGRIECSVSCLSKRGRYGDPVNNPSGNEIVYWLYGESPSVINIFAYSNVDSPDVEWVDFCSTIYHEETDVFEKLIKYYKTSYDLGNI